MSEPHLYINRQERTGVEGYRSLVLEEFQNKENTEALTTVTLAADGDLYNQSGD